MATWIVGGVLLMIVSLIVWKMIRDKKENKGGCSCGCDKCSGSCNH